MTYNGGIAKHTAAVPTRYKRVFGGVCAEVERSIKHGSEITGAPALPRDTSRLFFSYISKFLAPFRWRIATNVEYAVFVEDNVRGVRFRNGGPHGVKTTIAGADRILKVVAERERNA